MKKYKSFKQFIEEQRLELAKTQQMINDKLTKKVVLWKKKIKQIHFLMVLN